MVSNADTLDSRFVPSVSSIIYHGDKVARAEIRRKFMPKTAGPDFPIIVTSYEIAMLDARFLAHYRWTYVVVDEVTKKTDAVYYCSFMAFSLLCIHVSVL
jgi:hypothetical protein